MITRGGLQIHVYPEKVTNVDIYFNLYSQILVYILRKITLKKMMIMVFTIRAKIGIFNGNSAY